MANVLFIPVQYIKDNTYLDDNVSDKTIKIATVDAQDQLLEPVLGTTLYDKIKNDIKADTLAEPYITLITEKIYPFLIQAITYKIYINLIFRLTNSSIVKDSNDLSSAISLQELVVLKQERETGMEYHKDKLIKYLTFSSSSFPEYYSVDVTGNLPDAGILPINFYIDDETAISLK